MEVIMDSKEIKNQVKNKYGEIALQTKQGCGCGGGSCCSGEDIDYTIMSENYSGLDGYVADADMGLGCGLPTQHAGIQQGDTVVDLGAGAGNDVFVARSIVGESGRVIGVDMTDEMVLKANLNNQKLGYKNVEFKLGEIEDLPVAESTTDVVVSNCVLNLVPDKEKAFVEIFRILKPGGHFCISDIVLEGNLPDSLKEAAELYAGCVSGAIQKNEYLNIIKNSGFQNTEIKSTKKIDFPDELLTPYLTSDQMADFKKANIGIYSITVVGVKVS
jgi:arsenite methyltransferase